MSTVETIRTLPELKRRIAGWRAAGESVGLIPTMGALHEGHLQLVRLSQRHARRSVVSIFVNPTQFAPNEDFDRYPRDEAGDLAKLALVGCDLVWSPDRDVMYPEGFATRVVPAGAAEGLESDFRPGFFGGVATVCCKLFTQVAPDVAIFGEKDYQQLQVVRQMVRDLDLPLKIVASPTVRESDGLAMSSRNRYLSAEDRAKASIMHKVLQSVAAASVEGREGESLAAGRRTLEAAGFKVDYLEVRDAETLKPVEPGSSRARRALAAGWLGKTRLIDNIAVPGAVR